MSVNFAELILGAKTAGLLKGKKALEDTTKAARGTAKATAQSEKGFDSAGKGASRAEPKVKKFNTATKKTKQLSDKAAKALVGLALGYVGLGAAGSSITMAREFNSALAETSTLIDGTPEQLDGITEAARRMSTEFGGPATAQVQAFYQAISSGAESVAEASERLAAANMLAIGGATDVTTATGVLSGVINSYGREAISAAQVSDALFVGMKSGVTTVSQLADSLGGVIPTAKALGISFDEIVAATAALTKNNLTTSAAVTSLNAALVGIIKPTEQAKDVAEQLGIEFSATGLKSKGLAGFLSEIVEKTGGNIDAMSQLFGSVEALKAALLFAGEAGGQYTDILEQMENKSGATQVAFDKMSESLDQRMNVVVARGSEVALIFGNTLLAVAVPALEGAADAAFFMSQNTDTLILGIATLAATQIPLAIGAIATMSAGMSIAGVATGAFTVAVNGARIALVALGGPLGLVWGVLGAGAAAWVLWGEKAKEGGDAGYDAAAGTEALNTQLEIFRSSVAPAAAASAIDMANANHKLAASAYDAASAEVAKRRAMLADTPRRGDRSGALFTRATNEYTAALAHQENQEQALAQAIRDRTSAVTVVAGSMSEVMTQTIAATTANNELTLTLDTNTSSLGSNASAATAAATALSDLLDEVKQLEWDADPMLEYAAELAHLQTLAEVGLSDSAMAHAVDELNEKFIETPPLVEAVQGAISGMVDGSIDSLDDLVDYGTGILTQFLLDMVKKFASTNLSFGGVSAPSVSGGVSSGVLGSFGTAGGGVAGALGGGAGAMGGLGNAVSGGLGNVFSIGANATAAGGGFMATLGAAVPVLGVAAIAISLFKTKTKELDSGLRIMADGADVAVDSFKTVEKSMFWGLSKRTSTSSGTSSGEIADPITRAFRQIADEVVVGAENIGVASSVFKGFTSDIELSLKGLTDQEKMSAVTDTIDEMGNSFASMVPRLGKFKLEGESSVDTISRLSQSLTAVNSAFEVLDITTLGLSINSADAASEMVQLLGGLGEFQAATSEYYSTFYSDAERLSNAQDELSKSLAELGVSAIPVTHDAFRDLVDASVALGDLDIAAGLISVAPAFDVVRSALDDVTESAEQAAEAASQFAEDEMARLEASTLAERLGLERELLQVQGDTVALKALELESLYESNRPLQLRIWALREEAVASELAAAAAEQAAKAAADWLSAIKDTRGGYNLDADGFKNSFDAKMAFELSNQGQIEQDLITAQNIEIKNQSTLLRDIRDQLIMQTKNGEDSIFVSLNT